jgi:integrating conjugative element protein (TIGR03746 family)
MSKIFDGWLRQAWKKEDADAQIIKIQKGFIYILLLLSTLFSIGWMLSPSKLTIYIPPNIENGATLKVGSIPDPLIYSFAYEIWQEINYWQKEDGDAYSKNIANYHSYLTPRFKADLVAEAKDLAATGQLQRSRSLQGLSGAAYESINVVNLSSSTWEVDLRMRLTEFKNGQAVKDVEILYPLRVTRINVSPQNNPYGLALDGFIREPERLQTTI